MHIPIDGEMFHDENDMKLQTSCEKFKKVIFPLESKRFWVSLNVVDPVLELANVQKEVGQGCRG